MKIRRIILAMALLSFAITAKEPKWAGLAYNADRAMQYGKWEMRMRLSDGPGLVNAWFLINEDARVGNWYEIDIEAPGNRIYQVETVVHTGNNDTWRSAPYRYGHHAFEPELDQEYHTYGIEWTPTSLIFTLDDEPYRSARTQNDGSLRDISYPTSGPHQETRDTILSPQDNWVTALNTENAKMYMRCDFWACSTTEWCGVWTEENCGKAIYMSWFKYWKFTPDSGDDGSDWSLADFDTFDGPEWDLDRWENLNPADMVLKDGKACAVNNCQVKNDSGEVISEDVGHPGVVPVDTLDDSTSVIKAEMALPGMHLHTALVTIRGDRAFVNVQTSGYLRVSLFDVQGREIRVLFDGDTKPGTLKLALDAQTLAAGSYVLRCGGETVATAAHSLFISNLAIR